MEDQVYLRTTCIQNILHINQPERSFKKKKKIHTVVDPTKTLWMSQLSVVQIVIRFRKEKKKNRQRMF